MLEEKIGQTSRQTHLLSRDGEAILPDLDKNRVDQQVWEHFRQDLGQDAGKPR